jgi:DNA-binding NtrC family response regulator
MTESDIDQKRSHPLVDRYVTSDIPVQSLIQNTATVPSPVADALLALEQSLEGKRLARDAIELAQGIRIKGSDPELLGLMLSSWAELSCRIGRPSEAEALVHRAKALVADDTHPEVLARIMFVESILSDTTGNKARREEILKDIITVLPPFSIRRKFYVWELAYLLAQQGRGVESEKEVKELTWQCNEQFRISRVLLVQFVNAVETGQIKEASMLMPQIEPAAAVLSNPSRIPYRGYQVILDLMHDESAPLAPTSGKHPADDRDIYARVCTSLLVGDTEGALRLARLEADRLGAIFGAGFTAFNLIRAELSAGNGIAAGRLLRIRQSRGNRHFLDDLFFARVEVLAKNRRAAAKHFSAALKSVDYYRARGRLDFELRMARELSQADVVDLTRAADSIISRAAKRKAPPEPAARERRTAPEPSGINMILGRGEAITQIRSAIKRFAILDAPVLISGETGTGKEMVALALHQSSKHASAPFTPVNCGSITETLLESELFGHEKGAFTGAERANEGLFAATGQGTILLDEIGDISPRLQAALLRVLETGEIRAVGSSKIRNIKCRILAATNADLGVLADEGAFRQDLMFRLQRLGIYLPPIRERKEDILLLSRHFLDVGRPIGVHATMSAELRSMLQSYDWPGNIRELKNVIERMRLMHSDKLSYGPDDLDLKFRAVNVPQNDTVSVLTPPHSIAAATRSPTPPVTGPAPWPPPAAASPALPVPGSVGQSPMTDSEVADLLKSGNSPLRRLDRLRDLFNTHKKLTRSEIIKVIGVSPNTATKYLHTLREEGLIERIEPSASTRSHYFQLKESSE